MRTSDAGRAVLAATTTATAAGLAAADAVVLHDSNKLTVRLMPCDVVARVAPDDEQNAQFELDVARSLVASGSPVGTLDPRVKPRAYERDGFVITLWTYYEPATSRELAPDDYADALARLHTGMRKLEIASPHFTERVDQARQLVANRQETPELADAGRELLATTLRRLTREIVDRGGADQLLHGEPHPGNLLRTKYGPLFIDFETCCRGPVEFDLAHAPAEVSAHYPGLDQELLRNCRLLMRAMITTWRWDRNDQLPDGRRLGVAGLDQLRAAVG